MDEWVLKTGNLADDEEVIEVFVLLLLLFLESVQYEADTEKRFEDS